MRDRLRRPIHHDIWFNPVALISFALPAQIAAHRDHESVAVAHFESAPAEETTGRFGTREK